MAEKMREKKTQKILSIHNIIATILGFLTLALMFVIVVDVGGRFFFNKPLSGGVEVSQILLTWILFMPLAYALVRGAHVRVTILSMHLPSRVKRVLEVIVTIISIGFFGLAIFACWKYFWASISVAETMAAPIWLPLWAAKFALPLGFFLIFVQLCINLVIRLTESQEENH
jgi:TRAP-type C4-dicarboxylate transport system permease small subunit